MASFTITTTAPDTIKADNKGHAEAVFAVTNTTSRPVRGMARAVALESTKQEWLHLTGDTDRDFPAGGTQQYVVTFDGPLPVTPATPPAAGAPSSSAAVADKYAFRLNVALATNPDEDFAESPTIRVEMPSVAPAPPPKRFPKWIFIPIAVVLLLVIGLVLWLVLGRSKGEKVIIPDVANQTQQDAQTALESACKAATGCLVVTTQEVADETVPKGTAVTTDPVANTEVDVGAPVTLIVSSGPAQAETFKLPDVANSKADAAQKALEEACKKNAPCVKVEVHETSNRKVAKGSAIRTEPEAGTDVAIGSTVGLFVSKGADKVTIVNVENQQADNAVDNLQKSCEPQPCFDVQLTRTADNKVAAGRVIRSQPGPGTVVDAGSKVMLFVSGGTDEVTIPVVRGKSSGDAVKLLQNACNPHPCLQVTVNTQNDDSIDAGKAIGTNPSSGRSMKMGSSIVLNVSKGPELRLVGNYLKLTQQQASQRIVADGFVVGNVAKQHLIFMSTDQVIQQSPAAGSKLAKGSKINLTVLSK